MLDGCYGAVAGQMTVARKQLLGKASLFALTRRVKTRRDVNGSAVQREGVLARMAPVLCAVL